LVAVDYDAAGNETSDVTSSYVWNAESQTKTAGGVNYTYDGDGDRVEKSNGTLYWYGAGSQVLMETNLSGSLTSEYVYFGAKRVARRDASNDIYYYAEDMLGSSRAITTATGTVCYNADFYPYGGERAITNTCPQNYKFESKERDAETTNDDFGARYYSSAYGRFISADWSAIPAPVPYANLTNPQTLNLYAMVRDNPETFADLDGHILASWFYAAAGTNEFPLTKDDPALNRADFIPEYENPEPPPPNPPQNQQPAPNQAPAPAPTSPSPTPSGINPNYTFDHLLKKASDFSAGAGDFLSFGLTEKFREHYGYNNVVDQHSVAYAAGLGTGIGVAAAGSALSIARVTAGLETKIAIHGAEHAFGALGNLPHLQIMWWIAGAAGTGQSMGGPIRIPLVPLWPQ
jgi:RHS repeat-associated protein